MQPLFPGPVDRDGPPTLGERYQVVRELGKGAQAQVYLVWDLRTRAWGAAKVLARKFVDDADIRRRFEQEAHTMARLQHPHLLRVFDLGREGDLPYTIMELAWGGAITQWIRRNGPMPAGMAVAVAVQVAEGLDHAHRRGVIHRDVKPHNLLVVDRERVVLTDFGVAQAADASMTATGTVMGTFAYMAPEQRNDAKSVDARADVYALSATLFTMITGRSSAELFYADTDDELLAAVPMPLRAPLVRACAYKRDDRFENMKAFARALVAASQHLPTVDPTTPPLDDGRLELPDQPSPSFEPDAIGSLLLDLEPSEDDQPTYVPTARDAIGRIEEQATMRRTPGSQDATVRVLPPETRAPVRDELVDDTTMRPAPTTPVVTEEDDDGGVWRAVAAAVGIAAGVLFALWCVGVSGNVTSRWAVERTGDTLVDQATIAGGSLSAMIEAGADEPRLTGSWDTFQAETSPDAAAAFADVVAAELDTVSVDDLAMTRLHPMLESVEHYRKAAEARKARRGSFLERVSLGVGR